MNKYQMNKYQNALDEMIEADRWPLSHEVAKSNLRQAAAWANEQFTHILLVNTPGYPTRIAFHSSAEAHDFVKRNKLNNCVFDSIQFWEVTA